MKAREKIKRHMEFKPSLPSFIMRNSSVINKTDELIVLVDNQYANEMCNMLCIMETSLNGNIPL